MTANAINAMRLQEEKRHNREMEGENVRSRKTGLAGDILGATLRGLGTGVLAKVSGAATAAKTLSQIAKSNRQNNNNRGGRENGTRS